MVRPAPVFPLQRVFFLREMVVLGIPTESIGNNTYLVVLVSCALWRVANFSVGLVPLHLIDIEIESEIEIELELK